MTEQANTTSEAAARCRWGSKTDKPCWREAVVSTRCDELLGVPTLCEEHERASRLGREAEDLSLDLDVIHEVIAESMDYLEEKHEGGYRLRDLLYHQRGDMEREYLEKSVKSKAAWRVADRDSDEEPLDLAESERVEAQMIRADALTSALGILEELPGETYGNFDRWAIAAVLGSIERHPDAESEASRQRLSAEAIQARR